MVQSKPPWWTNVCSENTGIRTDFIPGWTFLILVPWHAGHPFGNDYAKLDDLACPRSCAIVCFVRCILIGRESFWVLRLPSRVSYYTGSLTITCCPLCVFQSLHDRRSKYLSVKLLSSLLIHAVLTNYQFAREVPHLRLNRRICL